MDYSEIASGNTTDIQQSGIVEFEIIDFVQKSDGSFYASLGVTTVPVLAAIWLFGSSIFGLFGFGRMRTRCSCVALVPTSV